jgi:hypothetical protein
MLRVFLEHFDLDDQEIDEYIEGERKELPTSLLMGNSPRQAMQKLGGDWGRDLMHHDLWVNVFNRTARRHLSLGLSIVVDDVRYENEVDAIRALGGEVLFIERPGNTKSVPKHSSEHFDFEPDYLVENAAEPCDLFKKIEGILNR